MVGSKAVVQKHAVAVTVVVFALVTAVLVFAAVGQTAFADERLAWIENRISLLEAVRRGYVNAEITATGSVGVAAEMLITSMMDITLAVTVEPGLVLDCDLPGVQRLVVRSPVEFSVGINVETPRFIELGPEETLEVQLEAYCLDARDRLPDPGTTYRPVGMASAPVERVLLTSIQEDEHRGLCALQAAVWIAQSNMTRSEFDLRLGARCLDTDVARAVALCNEAEVEPDISWIAQTVTSEPDADRQTDLESEQITEANPDLAPDPEPELAASVDPDPQDQPAEERSSSLGEWFLLGGLITFAILLVRLLEGF